MTTGWQPIESAPKDGTGVLLYPHMATAHWEFGDEQWIVLEIPLNADRTIMRDWNEKWGLWYCLYANVRGVEPTHWMSLPEPPEGCSLEEKSA